MLIALRGKRVKEGSKNLVLSSIKVEIDSGPL